MGWNRFSGTTIQRGSIGTAVAEMLPVAYAELRFFGALESEVIARVLDPSDAIIEQDWRVARALLHQAASDAD